MFPADGSHLARYAARFDGVEINSSFYRPHRPATYARWAAAVPDRFRFAVKLPRAISHVARLVGCEAMLGTFADQVAALGDRLGPVLVQLPPSLGFDLPHADAFFGALRTQLAGPAVCEPRHPGWFTAAAERLLRQHRIARVAADPPPVAAAAVPGGWDGFVYLRLHGSPRVYYSGYGAERLAAWADRLRDAAPAPAWCILDNTARGEAAADAATLQAMVTD